MLLVSMNFFLLDNTHRIKCKYLYTVGAFFLDIIDFIEECYDSQGAVVFIDLAVVYMGKLSGVTIYVIPIF